MKCGEEILGGTPVAKATFWSVTDADVRKRGDQKRIRYPGSPDDDVRRGVAEGVGSSGKSHQALRLGDDRKVETQRN